MKFTQTLPLFVASMALLAGCSTTPKAPTTAAAATPASEAPAPAAAKPEAAPPAAAIPAYLDPSSPIYQHRSVYFDFDSSAVKSQYNDMLQQHGSFLSSHPAVHIRVEGNCDERGSAEYNLALGQRRADAVVSALKIAGANANQMESISWGKEKPKAKGHDEAAWAENRRADLVYPTK